MFVRNHVKNVSCLRN